MDKKKNSKVTLKSDVATAFYTSEERAGRVLNREGGELNDIVTLTEWSEKIMSMKSDSTDESGKPIMRYWLPVKCSGDAESVSLTNLVGTSKRRKYFPTPDDSGKFKATTNDSGDEIIAYVRADKEVTTYVSDFAEYTDILTLPKTEIDAATEVEKYFGKRLKRIAIAENCGAFKQTFNLWAVLPD